MNFETYAYTDCGSRSNNEDTFIHSDTAWVVCDGLGGHGGGEVASEKAARIAIDLLNKNKQNNINDDLLREVLVRANQSVIDAQNETPDLKHMRTTIVLAVSDGNILRYANVGDSRFYYFKKGKLAYQSQDHSLSAISAKIGSISDVRTDPDRNKLLKALGNSEHTDLEIPQDEIVLEPGDTFLLCSDGFWEYVYEEEMEIDLAKSISMEQWMKFMLKRVLLKTQTHNNDNFTAICVKVVA